MRQEEAERSCCLVIDCSPGGRLMPGSINVTAPTSPPSSTLLRPTSPLLVHCAEHLPRPETAALVSTLALQKYDSAPSFVLSCSRSVGASVLLMIKHEIWASIVATGEPRAELLIALRVIRSIMTYVMRRDESGMKTVLLMYVWQLKSLMKWDWYNKLI